MNVRVQIEGTVSDAPDATAAYAARKELLALGEIEVCLDDGIAWSWMRPIGRPSATPTLIEDCHAWAENLAVLADVGDIRYGVLGSRFPGVWNLGGDLNLFAQLIREGNLLALTDYGLRCVSWCRTLRRASTSNLVTISLVQGSAMGGGFEAARMCDILVAEKSAKFALPEALFNLFPGMGAVSFLVQRVGPRRAREMLLDGMDFTAQALFDAGVVDILAEDGLGEDAVRDFARTYRRRHSALSAICGAVRDAGPSDAEMEQIVRFWAECAIRTADADLRMMERLVARQDKLLARRPTA